jgi:hypothetical protein
VSKHVVSKQKSASIASLKCQILNVHENMEIEFQNTFLMYENTTR